MITWLKLTKGALRALQDGVNTYLEQAREAETDAQGSAVRLASSENLSPIRSTFMPRQIRCRILTAKSCRISTIGWIYCLLSLSKSWKEKRKKRIIARRGLAQNRSSPPSPRLCSMTPARTCGQHRPWLSVSCKTRLKRVLQLITKVISPTPANKKIWSYDSWPGPNSKRSSLRSTSIESTLHTRSIALSTIVLWAWTSTWFVSSCIGIGQEIRSRRE